MRKWIMAAALVMMLTGLQGITTEAVTPILKPVLLSVAGEAEPPLVEVMVPQNNRVTSRETIMVSFRAPRNSQVTVEVFHNTSLTEEENFTLLYEPMAFAVGVLERGWVELKLKRGMNRILLTAVIAGETGDPVIEIIERRVTVKDLEEVREELTRNVMQTTATELIRRLTNMSR